MHTFVLSKMVHAKTAEIIQMESLRDYLDSEPQLYEGAIKLSCFPINVQDNRDDTAWAYAYQLKVDVLMLFHVINTTDEHYILLKEILENLLHRYGFSVDDFCVTRVDFCENVVVRNAKERELLFRLLQSCPTHAAYTVRESIYDSSVYSKSKSRTFNIYDKEKERRDKMRIRHNPNLYPQDYEQNVIRFEHQIRKDHIKYKRRNGVPSKYDYWINAETEQPPYDWQSDIPSLNQSCCYFLWYAELSR